MLPIRKEKGIYFFIFMNYLVLIKIIEKAFDKIIKKN